MAGCYPADFPFARTTGQAVPCRRRTARDEPRTGQLAALVPWTVESWRSAMGAVVGRWFRVGRATTRACSTLGRMIQALESGYRLPRGAGTR